MKRFTDFLERNASGKKVLALFILTNVVYLFMLMVTIPMVMGFSQGMKLLDMLPTGYDQAYVKELFAALGAEGRAAYLTRQIPVDMVYPFLFGLSYSLVLAYFLKKLNRLRAPYVLLCLLPVVAGVADYFENLGISVMLKNYPAVTGFAVDMTNFFSLLKSGTTTIFFLVLILLLCWFAFKALRNKRSGPKVSLERLA